MAEVIGVVSGVVGIATFAVQTTTTLINLIGSIREAPDVLLELDDGLKTLKIALDRLAEVEKHASDSSDDDGASNSATKHALKGCDRVLERIANELDPLQRQLRQGRAQAVLAITKTVIRESSIKDQISRLDSSKMNLVIAMAVDDRHAQMLSDRSSRSETSQHRGGGFSWLLNETLANMEQSLSGKGSSVGNDNVEAFKALLSADTDKIQDAWKPNMHTISSLKALINDHSYSVFLQILKPNSQTRDGVKSAASSTLDWLWTNNCYTEWFTPCQSKTLLVKGKPGSGKSVLVKTVVERLLTQSQRDGASKIIVLSYFCNNRERPDESCSDILRNFIFQYLRTNKSEFGRLIERCESLGSWDRFQDAESFTLSFEALWDIFFTILDTTLAPETYCIIDAMDECAQDDTTKAFIEKLIALPTKSNGATKLLLSARLDWMAEYDLSHISPEVVELRLGSELMYDDIAIIVNAEFSKLEKRLSIDQKEINELKQKLIFKADGMILWVVLALREVNKKLVMTVKWLREIIEKLPLGLSQMYDRILHNMTRKHDGRDNGDNEETSIIESTDDDIGSDMHLAWKAIQWVARAGRPLTLRELEVALSLKLGDKSFDETQARRIANMEDFIQRISFLEIVPAEEKSTYLPLIRLDDRDVDESGVSQEKASPIVRLIHQSAKDYFVGNNVRLQKERQKLRLPDFLDEDIAGLLVTFLTFSDFDDAASMTFPTLQESSKDEYLDAYVESFGFLEYAVLSWGYHIRQIPKPDGPLLSLVTSFTDSQRHTHFWYKVDQLIRADYISFNPEFSGLHVAATEGLDSVVQHLINRGDDLNVLDILGHTPYMLALENGFNTVAKRLESAGASTNTNQYIRVFNTKLTPLMAACFRGTNKAVEECIDEGCAVDDLDACGRTALFYAGQRGQIDKIGILLDAGIDSTIKDRHGRLALDVTVEPRCRDVLLNRQQEQSSPVKRPENLCLHTQTAMKSCDNCDCIISGSSYHCCICAESDSYDICKLCWDNGQRCADGSHEVLLRNTLDGMESWPEYSPHLADIETIPIGEEIAGIPEDVTKDVTKDEGQPGSIILCLKFHQRKLVGMKRMLRRLRGREGNVAAGQPFQ
ncbi:Vegetative incompatibility HET-E-1-like protein [Cladobotryum mycophilum]|uniref:Vegetative incompatibility HET-E-1-like protein n=1 Tax=Cladobotryum mycophilum TaxID=491253 RepID=A0ABR0SQR5_9HYPO